VVIWQSRTSHVVTEGTLGGVSAGCKPLQTMPKMAMATLNGGFRATVLTTPKTARAAARSTRAIQAGRERARDSNLIGAAGLEGLNCQNYGGRPLHALSFHPLARPHAAVMAACRSHRRQKDEGIQFTGYALHLCGQGCNKRPPCSLSVCHLPMPHSGGPMLAIPVIIGLEIVRIWSRSVASGGV
jgi:hypothetical protein